MQGIIDSEFKGCTVLAVMHRLVRVAAYDQVALMHAGAFGGAGSPVELIAGETRIAELYKSHSQ